jgi:hypothetical protein
MNRPAKRRPPALLTKLIFALAFAVAVFAEPKAEETPAAQPFSFLHSMGLEKDAESYRLALAQAVVWFRRELGWQGEFSFAVFNRDDYASATFTPYPTPHTQSSERRIIIPDSIASYPGFDTWGVDAVALNTALSIHELGHIIAGDLGLATGNGWFNELLANLFLAAYIDAGHPELATFTLGVEPGSPADQARYRSLVDLDDLYSGVGARNYAWYQFRIGALADLIMDGRRLTDIVDALKTAFPGTREGNRPETAEALARLEEIRPGLKDFIGELAGPSTLPEVAAGVCAARGKATSMSRDIVLVLVNRSRVPLRLHDPEVLQFMAEAEVSLVEGEPGWAEAVAAKVEELRRAGGRATVVGPGERSVRAASAGAEWRLPDGTCFTVPDSHAQFIWKGVQ